MNLWASIKAALVVKHNAARREFLKGAAVVLAAPIVVKVASVLPAPVETLRAETVSSIYGELCAVTRRAFIPRLFVDIYCASPTLKLLMEKDLRTYDPESQNRNALDQIKQS